MKKLLNSHVKLSTLLVLLCVILFCSMLMGAAPTAVQATLSPDVAVKYNGVAQVMRDADGNVVHPIIYKGTTYAPLRAVSNMLGMAIEWDGTSRTVSIDSPAPAPAYVNNATAQYDVVKRDKGTFTVDGVVNDAEWADVPGISGCFHFPWENVEAPYTEFKAGHDGDDFYFSFVVHDKEVVAEDSWKSDESTVDVEDRVELFFAGPSIDQPTSDYALSTYYAIEADPKGRVHDYSIVYYRKFDSAWNMSGLETKATTTDDGYVVEGKISIAELKKLKLINENNVMRTGVFRAEFSKSASGLVMQWISWIDPKTSHPDFHVDSAFGEFRFLQ